MIARAIIIDALTIRAATEMEIRDTAAERFLTASHGSTPSRLRIGPVAIPMTVRTTHGTSSDAPNTMANAAAYPNTGRPPMGPRVASHAPRPRRIGATQTVVRERT